MKKGNYNHSGRKVGRGTHQKAAPRKRYAKAVKKRFHVSAVAANDGHLGPHQMEMGQRYTIVIRGSNEEKIVTDLTNAGFVVEDIMTADEYRRVRRAVKQSKSSDAAERRIVWAVRAKHDSSKARHKLRIPPNWSVYLPAGMDTIAQCGQAVRELAERVMSRLGGLVDQQRLDELETGDAQA